MNTVLPKFSHILLISLTNIGDVILTFPVIDILLHDFPQAKLSLVIGPKAKALFDHNANFEEIFVFDKKQPLGATLKWLYLLRQKRFDCVVDLRNTAIPFLIGSPYKTSPFFKRIAGEHVRLQHLRRLQGVYDFKQGNIQKRSLVFTRDIEEAANKMIQSLCGKKIDYVLVGPGAADRGKRWTAEGFAKICDKIITQFNLNVILTGDENDRATVSEVMSLMKQKAFDVSGQTSLLELACLIKRAKLCLFNDSAPMHLASYLDIPVVALFGLTSPQKYGPWGKDSYFIHKDSKEASTGEECMARIHAEDVMSLVAKILGSQNSPISSH